MHAKAPRKRFQHLLQHLFDFIERCLRMLNNAKHGVGKRFQHLFRFCFNNIAREALYKAFFNSWWLTIFEMHILEIFGWFEMNGQI